MIPDDVRRTIKHALVAYWDANRWRYENDSVPHVDKAIDWLDNLPQPPQPVYSHRNGETEPPTEQGHYWFRGLNTRTDHRVRRWVMGRIDINMLFIYAYGWGRPEEFIGEWHGPIPEPQQENNAE